MARKTIYIVVKKDRPTSVGDLAYHKNHPTKKKAEDEFYWMNAAAQPLWRIAKVSISIT